MRSRIGTGWEALSYSFACAEYFRIVKEQPVSALAFLAGVSPAAKRRVFPPERTASAKASGGIQNRARALPGVLNPQSGFRNRPSVPRYDYERSPACLVYGLWPAGGLHAMRHRCQ